MSTAKSMANSYLNGKRTNSKLGSNLPANRFKSSTSNLSSISSSNNVSASKIKSTSMTNLLAGSEQENRSLVRPISRNALDSIHNGMNAKYAQVQSKVYLQNIKPSAAANNSRVASKSNTLRSNGGRLTPANQAVKVPSDRTQLMSKLKALQEELEHNEEEKESLRQELEREKADKAEQVQQLKQELQEKLVEHDKQHEEYHQKLLEAYELADQNRRAADSVLSESRQRDEESRKRIEELEAQLAELKEFVSMKEEMTGKMYELREQIREERERYEEQLKSLHQVFENEKLRQEELEAESSRSKKEGGNKRLEQNSSYFKRVKPSLQSNESINGMTNCEHCKSGASQLHQSEQDIYGSKMSTRMQDTARSAWKASKHFASSVITGGVNLSACRKRSPSSSSTATAKATPTNAEGDINNNKIEEQHTSVVKVEANCVAPSCQQQQQAAQDNHLIRVDENNKLTIVTKFNDVVGCQGSNSSGLDTTAATSSSGSERSRCESSSSGRGTSSDAGSSGSQNGDVDASPVELQCSSLQQKACNNNSNNHQAPSQIANQSAILMQCNNETKKCHRRKSSLFKTSKMFSNSQVSLNKLKYFFTGNASNKATISEPKQELDARSIEQHLESSRIRCMELNRATKMLAGEVVPNESELNNNHKANEEEEEVSSKVNIESSASNYQHHLDADADPDDKQAPVVALKVGQGGAQQLAVAGS